MTVTKWARYWRMCWYFIYRGLYSEALVMKVHTTSLGGCCCRGCTCRWGIVALEAVKRNKGWSVQQVRGGIVMLFFFSFLLLLYLTLFSCQIKPTPFSCWIATIKTPLCLSLQIAGLSKSDSLSPSLSLSLWSPSALLLHPSSSSSSSSSSAWSSSHKSSSRMQSWSFL